MDIIREALNGLRLGESKTVAGLTVFPLLSGETGGNGAPDYIPLEEALEAGVARVTEVSESGTVPELHFTNDGERPVLLVDGAALIGAKQNRVLNLSILAPGQKTIVIPVSCSESGRWHRRSAAFSTADHLMYASGKARKMAQVSSALKASRGSVRRSDQAAVWGDIEAKMFRLSTKSPSSEMNEMYRKYEERLRVISEAFVAEDGQVGLLLGLNGDPVGVEVFDRPQALRTYLPKILRSYGLEALELTPDQNKTLSRQAAEGFVSQVAEAETKSYDAVGLGKDLRLEGRTVAGGALVVDGGVVHLTAFQMAQLQ